jgi:hypothetical protein
VVAARPGPVLLVVLALVTGCATGRSAATPEGPEPQIAAAVTAALDPPGWESLHLPASAALAESGAPEWRRDRCLDVAARNRARCVYGPASTRRRALLLGDSFGVSWLPGLRTALPDWRIGALTRRQCPNADVPAYVDGVRSTSCDLHRAWALDQVARQRPDLVVLADAWMDLGNLRGRSPADDRTRWAAGLTRVLRRLLGLHVPVVVLGAPPGSGDLQTCRIPGGTPRDCISRPSAQWRTFTAAEVRAAQEARVPYVDVLPWFCAAGRCPAVVAATPVYVDGEHLGAAYAARLGPVLRPRLLAAAGRS